jgi:putative Mg2+ transporter-C (MgtC) family protein
VPMPLNIGWGEIALRLALTVAAGILIGINRSEHGHAAGLRTTLLVCLAASLSMLQVNLLLPMTGKTPSSFAVMDLMRLPLGILSGMGFIGAGAIVRKDNFVHGLTTAATLWFVTGLGLCFGGGQLALGLVGLALGVVVLEVLKRVENRCRQDRHAMLSVIVDTNGPTEEELTSKLQAEGYVISPWGVVCLDQDRRRELQTEVRWRARPDEARSPAFLQEVVDHPGVLRLEWKP